MTLASLQSIVLSLANQCHVRYWRWYNYPQEPECMAIEIQTRKREERLAAELKKKGMTIMDISRARIFATVIREKQI